MGVSIEMWRCRIGCFSQPMKCKSAMQVLILSGFCVSLSIRITLFLLLAMHGVKQNPGPGSRGGNVRGNSGRGKGRGQGRDTVITRDPDFLSQSSDVSQTRRSTRLRPDQPSLNAWLNNSRLTSDTNTQNSSASQRPSECSTSNSSVASNIDLEYDQMVALDHDVTVRSNHHENLSLSILLDIQKDCKNLNTKFDKLDKSVNELKKENKKLQE